MRAISIRASSASHLVVLLALLGSIASCGRNDGPLDPAASTSAGASASEDASARAARITRPGYDVRDYNEVITAHDAALNARDFWLYSLLLAPDFEFWPRPEDWLDFPWMDGYSWPLFEELNMIGNMFNPNYSGNAPAIESIQVSTEIFNTNEIEPGRIELTCTMQGVILTSDTDGWSIDTGLVFELVSENGGGFHIRKITEADPVGRVEGSSWGLIKGLYRGAY